MTGAELRAWRKSRRWSQDELARRLRRRRSTVAAMEAAPTCHVHKTIELSCYALEIGVTAFDGREPTWNLTLVERNFARIMRGDMRP